MAHPLESAITETIKSQRDLEKKLATLEQDLKSALDRGNVMQGRINQLEQDLQAQKDAADYYLRWNVEITRQLQNISMFVNDAMEQARVEVAKGNRGNSKQALDAVEQALIGVEDAAVQHEGKR